MFGQYSAADTTWTFNYKQMSKIHKEIEVCKNTRYLLQDEIELLIKQDMAKGLIIEKLILRDSLYQKELEKAAQIEALYREKVIIANEIMNNYKILLLTSEEQIAIEAKKAKKERLWKNIYRYSYMAAGGIVAGILIFK
jgi:hypothetical protein